MTCMNLNADIERCCMTIPVNSTCWRRYVVRPVQNSMLVFTNWGSALRSKASSIMFRTSKQAKPLRQIEDFPAGYPRFSALIASHDHFHVCRRFAHLRSRLMLAKQDKLSILERRLNALDQDETNVLRLGCCREDDNEERNSLLHEISEELAEYDELLTRNQQVFSYDSASPRAVQSLHNWTEGNGCIARAETAYLGKTSDLLSVTSRDQTTMWWLELLIEKTLVLLRPLLRSSGSESISRDPRVHIYPKGLTSRISRVAMTPLIVAILLLPVIICNRLENLDARLFTIVVAATAFVAILSESTKVRAVELAVAGATYTTVLIVFIASNSGSSSKTSTTSA